MTIEAKRNDIERIENPGLVVLDVNDMVNLQHAVVAKVVANKSAMTAGVSVSFHDCAPKGGVCFVASLASRFVSELLRESTEVKVFRKPVRVLFGVVIPMRRTTLALATDGRNLIGSQPFVPNRNFAKLCLSAIGMMTALVFGNAQAAATFLVDRERAEFLAAPAFASDGDSVCLLFGDSHTSSIPDAGNIENRVNCGNPQQWAIRSQASQEWVEGSTTRAWSPDRTVKPHERATRKGRDSLNSQATERSAGLNASTITNRPYSGKLEALSKFEVRKPVMQALRNDAVKTFDRAAWAQFNASLLKVVPATAGTSTTVLTLTTNGTATATNNIAFQKEHAKLVVDLMKERNIPGYTNDDYVAIAWPTALRRLKNDLESIHQYTSAGIQLIFNAEIGRYENVRYVEQTNIPKGNSTDGGLTGTAWASGNDWIFFMGEDTVAEGVAIPEEMRAKIPTDFGRSKGVAWYYLGGFGVVQTSAVESRIVQWASAA